MSPGLVPPVKRPGSFARVVVGDGGAAVGAAPFRPLMRLYQPQPAILDGTHKIPPITKAAS